MSTANVPFTMLAGESASSLGGSVPSNVPLSRVPSNEVIAMVIPEPAHPVAVLPPSETVEMVK